MIRKWYSRWVQTGGRWVVWTEKWNLCIQQTSWPIFTPVHVFSPSRLPFLWVQRIYITFISLKDAWRLVLINIKTRLVISFQKCITFVHDVNLVNLNRVRIQNLAAGFMLLCFLTANVSLRRIDPLHYFPRQLNLEDKTLDSPQNWNL